MSFLIFLAVVVIGLIICCLFNNDTQNLKPSSYNLLYWSGLEKVENKRALLTISPNEKMLYLDFENKKTFNINFDNIKDVELLKEIKHKNKSVVGRAVVGGLLLGPVGAVVGGMSGLGQKEEKDYYLKISTSNHELIFKALSDKVFDLSNCFITLNKIFNNSDVLNNIDSEID